VDQADAICIVSAWKSKVTVTVPRSSVRARQVSKSQRSVGTGLAIEAEKRETRREKLMRS
jgi:hypothetical protein